MYIDMSNPKDSLSYSVFYVRGLPTYNHLLIKDTMCVIMVICAQGLIMQDLADVSEM